MSGVRICLGLACGLALAIAMPADAQDIELASQIGGVPLPQAYYDFVREHPDAFQLEQGWRGRVEHSVQAGAAVEGRLPVLTVQILFSDSPEPFVSAEELRRVLFDGPSEYGTITDAWLENSGGRLQVDGHVTAWVRTSLTLAEAVGDNFGLGQSSRLGEAMVEALEQIDGEIDWGAFDNDGPDNVANSGDDDGFVDAVAFQFIESSASCGGPGPWPHRFSMNGRTGDPFVTSDTTPSGEPIRVNDYIIQSSVTCAGDQVATSAVFAHELGHVLGLPDLYHAIDGIQPTERRWVVGCWSLMAGGSWGCGDPSARTETLRPPHLGAWEKVRLGWVDVQTIGEVPRTTFEIGPVRETGQVLRFPIGTAEHYLVEYRDQKGFDAELPAEGVLIYHVDESMPFRPEADDPRHWYRVKLIEADGNEALLRTAVEGGDRGVAGDAFGNLTARSFNIGTTPAAELNRNGPSDLNIHSITLADGVARLDLTTEPIPFARLLDGFMDREGPGLTADEEALFDGYGNGNGQFDIGDLRRYHLAR